MDKKIYQSLCCVDPKLIIKFDDKDRVKKIFDEIKFGNQVKDTKEFDSCV